MSRIIDRRRDSNRLVFKVKYTDNSTAWTGVQVLVKTHAKLVNEFVSKTNNESLVKKEKKWVEKDTKTVVSKIISSTSSIISIKKKRSRQKQ